MLEELQSTEDIDLGTPRQQRRESIEGKPAFPQDIRQHGCQKPHSTGQMLTWLAVLIFILTFLFLISPVAFSANHSSKEYLVPSFLFMALAMVVVYSISYATLYVPTDPHLLGRHVPVDKMTWTVKDRIFQSVPSVHKLKWCDLCEWVIDEKSAHCISCKRCTYDVSHHCWFVNNCIGKGNYTAFMTLLVTSLLLVLVEFFLAIKVIWIAAKQPNEFDARWSAFYGIETVSTTSTSHSYNSSKYIVAPFMVVLLLLLIAAMGFILQFLSFQVMLKLKGMTMLQYVSRGNDEDVGVSTAQ
jgi:hypothetical protein